METLHNPTREEYGEKAHDEDCPEADPDHQHTGHVGEFESPSKDGVETREVCAWCGEVVAEWDSFESAVEATKLLNLGICPGCEKQVAVDEQGGQGQTVDGDAWHRDCWYKDAYGFEDTHGDAPEARNPNRPYNLHRTVKTEIDGEEFEWDEYVYTRLYQDHGRYNLPTRDELTPEQLETLREWEVGENPTGDDRKHEYDFSVGEFPARFVLIGGYGRDAPSKWICPDCGEIVEPKVNDRFPDLEAECAECGSNRWLTHGEPLIGDEDAFAPLSDRERQVVHVKMLGSATDKEIADALDVEPSTVREYHERAKSKAERGKRLYDKMETWDVL